jgi:aspartyl-tRNA(Asn)/glutamyl-tRNA(Gln) amidotransferase subunit C
LGKAQIRGFGMVNYAPFDRSSLSISAEFFPMAAPLDITQKSSNIEKSDIEKIARLARISINEGEVDELTRRLGNILALVDELKAVDTSGVAPMANPHDANQRLRADIVTEPNLRDAFQAIAPETEAGLYLVPKVLE